MQPRQSRATFLEHRSFRPPSLALSVLLSEREQDHLLLRSGGPCDDFASMLRACSSQRQAGPCRHAVMIAHLLLLQGCLPPMREPWAAACCRCCYR